MHAGTAAFAAVVGCAAANGSPAQPAAASAGLTYPAKPIRMVVPFAPGGGTDVIARHLAARMSESFKRPIVVNNRAGANGIVGTENGGGEIALSTPEEFARIIEAEIQRRGKVVRALKLTVE